MALIVFSWPDVYFKWWHFPAGEGILFVCQQVWIRNTMKSCWEAGAPVYRLRLVSDESWSLIYTLINVDLLSITCPVCPCIVFVPSHWRRISTCVMTQIHLRTFSPWILSICPSFRAAPRTLQSVRTILSALASERKALESSMAFLSPKKNTHTSFITDDTVFQLHVIIFDICLLEYFNLVVMVILCSPLSISTGTF